MLVALPLPVAASPPQPLLASYRSDVSDRRIVFYSRDPASLLSFLRSCLIRVVRYLRLLLPLGYRLLRLYRLLHDSCLFRESRY